MLYKLRLRWSTKYQLEISIALTSGFNSLDFRFLRLYFWNSNSENTVLHQSLNLIHLRILWQPETPQELATAALNTVPRVILVFLSPLIRTTLSSSTSTFTSSFLSLGRSTLNTWASRVSFQSIQVLMKAKVFVKNWGTYRDEDEGNRKSLNGSQMSCENGSKILLRLPLKKLGINDILNLWMLWLESKTIGWLVAIAKKFGWWK